MPLAEDLRREVKSIIGTRWLTRDGQVVPDATDVKLGNDAVHFKRATILYADLHGSTDMVDTWSWAFCAEVYKSFLLCAARVIRSEGGVITAYDGDRVMAVFIGDYQSTNATRCGLKINWACKYIVQPALKAQYSATSVELRQCVGIDTSAISIVRTGVRGNNDLVFVGRAANYAAKLTELDEGHPTWITHAVYHQIQHTFHYGGVPRRMMWEERAWSKLPSTRVYRSSWWWPVTA